jgi:hypothetical protein
MSELTRRRDTSRNEETWLIFLEDVHIGTIGRRAGVPTDAEQWGWRCGLSGSRHRAGAEGTAADFVKRDLNLKRPGAECGRVTATRTSPTIGAHARLDGMEADDVGNGTQASDTNPGRPLTVLLRCRA